MTCFMARNLFSDLIEARLKPERKGDVEAHLRECPQCSLIYERVERNLHRCRELPKPAIPERVLQEWRTLKKRGLEKRLLHSSALFLPLLALFLYLILTPRWERREEWKGPSGEPTPSHEESGDGRATEGGRAQPGEGEGEGVQNPSTPAREGAAGEAKSERARGGKRRRFPSTYSPPELDSFPVQEYEGPAVHLSTLREDASTLLKREIEGRGWSMEYIEPLHPRPVLSAVEDYLVVDVEIPDGEEDILFQVLQGIGSIIHSNIEDYTSDGVMRVRVSIHYVL